MMSPGGRPPKDSDDRRSDRIPLMMTPSEKAELLDAKNGEDPENKTSISRWILDKVFWAIRSKK